ncbi:MAG TPA: lytic transglycosylase domain-containing protein [Candidatus Limnocylindrales bacterium]|nr:lytic transglycosylase domain-containing protein [Candidatus Limnocylindrales bacterium]
MPSPRQICRNQRQILLRGLVSLSVALAGFLASASSARAQITSVTDESGRRFFVNAEPPALVRAATPKAPPNIYLSGELRFMQPNRPALRLDRDGVEKLVREAADRHNVDPALVRAVIETESGWNPVARSRKGAMGLMQLIPTTAQRFGANDAFNPKQNVEAGVHYLRVLLERYNGNLDLALAAYNAGEGAVDRAHGIPSIRETRNYIQRVQDAYFRPGSGRLDGAYSRGSRIHREVDANGRTIFTNE